MNNKLGGKKKKKKKKAKKKKSKKKKSKKKKGKSSSPPPMADNHPLIEDKPFYIYTTGIGEWGDLTKAAAVWFTIIQPYILKKIPSNFNAIHIYHYDPLNDPTIMNDKNVESIISEINKLISENSNDRIKSASFYQHYFDTEHIKSPYILIDLGHIFMYGKKDSVIYSTHTNISSKKVFHIKSIYPGYHTSPIPKCIIQSDYLNIDNNGKVTTFINRLFDLNYFNDNDLTDGYVEYTSNPIEHIYNSAIKKFLTNNEYINYLEIHIQHIINFIIDNIMKEGIPLQELINKTYEYIIELKKL